MTGIELIPDTVALTVGSNLPSEIWADYSNSTRSRLFIPSGAAIAYTSENNAVASVDAAGKISLNAPGTTNIHVSYLGFTAQSALTSSLVPPPHVLTAIGAVSRKTHGMAGDFDIDLPLSGIAGIECRSGGANGDYQVVFNFASAVTLTNAAVTSGAGSVASTAGAGTQTITVNLTGVTNAQRITVTLSAVNNGTTTGDVNVQMGVLVGDTNGNGTVSASDIGQTKAQAGQTVTSSNFREDVNANGAITASDIALVKSLAGMSLPPVPNPAGQAEERR